jgi:hypothetical protein
VSTRQAPLFPIEPRGENARRTVLPPPWRRTDGGQGKIGATYAGPGGYWVQHCGHPTALWPYALYSPDGRLVLAPNGRAWRTLGLAAGEVARRLGGLE